MRGQADIQKRGDPDLWKKKRSCLLMTKKKSLICLEYIWAMSYSVCKCYNGTDDYITKPFNPLEVVARVKTQLGYVIQCAACSVLILQNSVSLYSCCNRVGRLYYIFDIPAFEKSSCLCVWGTGCNRKNVRSDCRLHWAVPGVEWDFENTEITISAQCQEDTVSIIFCNHGDTIPEEKLNRIFEQLYRLDAARSASSGGVLD